jgi:hypothetical protein
MGDGDAMNCIALTPGEYRALGGGERALKTIAKMGKTSVSPTAGSSKSGKNIRK